MNKYCSSCGVEMPAEAPQCRSCGAIQDNFVYKSRVAAAVIAFSTGLFGIHRFYLGQWWGIFYLLFFWTYIPMLVAIIEGIVFLATSQKVWNDKYNRGLSLGTEKGGVVVIVPLVFIGIAMVGIIAAIALPAYQDYTNRSKVLESKLVAQQLMPAVESYAFERQQWPRNLEQLDIAAPRTSDNVGSVEIDAGVIIVAPPASTGIAGALVYIPKAQGSSIVWDCTESTIDKRYLPADCR